MAETELFTATMPGAFNIAHDFRAGHNSNIFQPPRTPSVASSMHLSRSTASLISDQSDHRSTTRKRTRTDYTADSRATPRNSMRNWTSRLDNEDLMARSGSIDLGSPVPFVNTRYQLAGGLDTPTAAAAAQYGEDSGYSDVEYRRSFPDAREEEPESYFPRLSDSNQLPHVPNLSQQSSSGLTVALELVGTVVGKVWEFCKTGAFRGFTAGGGTQYGIDQKDMPSSDMWQESTNDENPTLFSPQDYRESTPVPGQFPDDEVTDNYFQRNRQSSDMTPRSSKRRQVDSSDAGLARNWVVVPDPDSEARIRAPKANVHSIGAGAPRYSMPTSSGARRTTGGPAAGIRPSSRLNAPRRSLHTTSRTSTVSHAGSPALRSNRPASFASPRSPGGSTARGSATAASPAKHSRRSSLNASPAAIEAQRWAERKRREDQEADESIRRFNAQLKAMIREGKQALGSKVEVEIEEDIDVESEEVEGGFEKVERSGW